MFLGIGKDCGDKRNVKVNYCCYMPTHQPLIFPSVHKGHITFWIGNDCWHETYILKCQIVYLRHKPKGFWADDERDYQSMFSDLG